MGSHRPKPGSTTEGMLANLMRDTLDPAYAEAAAGRGSAGVTRTGGRALVAVLATVVVLGLLLGMSYADTRASAPASERARQGLLADVVANSARSAALQQRLEAARAGVATAVDEQLAATVEGRQQTAQVARLEGAAAVLAVVGPGLVVTLSDAPPQPGTDPVTGQETSQVPEAGRILDTDLQAIVNALWDAGAEGIAINDQRLAPTSSIRTAGEAVLVDFRPVTSPYEVSAIGDPDRLPARFAGSPTAGRYDAYRQLYAIGFTLATATVLRLPAAPDTQLRYAEPVQRPPAPGETK